MAKELREEISAELFEAQSEIIRKQSDVIDELFRLLSMHLTALELDQLPVLDKIDEAAQIRAEYNL